ncbi:uncharacterized protein LOC127802280 [Diospyros lotus]|uniref:uncharacterized protein LOC127802280 n=1 Tax=Diospyros lotus TaxID=55363 RepID=UPI00224E018F|nr:uncharacterized protein LOC127802280 [Diospyros lotus]
MRNFVIVQNTMKFKTTSHAYKLNFTKTTQVIEVHDVTVPATIFAFRAFNDILSEENVDETRLFDRGWWYLSCKKCAKKVKENGNRFYWEKCERFDTSGNPRFKIRVRIVDGTESASFLLWDRECLQLIGKSTSELRDCLARDGAEDYYPGEVETLVNMRLLFKVQIRDQNLSRTDDLYTEPDLLSKLEKTIDADSKGSVSDNEVSTPVKTPAKRTHPSTCDDVSSIVPNEDKGSSTQLSSNKLRKFVKVEKD